MLYPPGFYYVKKPRRFVILSSDKSSEHNLSCFFDIIKPRRIEHLQSEEPFSSDPYFRDNFDIFDFSKYFFKNLANQINRLQTQDQKMRLFHINCWEQVSVVMWLAPWPPVRETQVQIP